jgi:hypothetical protein
MPLFCPRHKSEGIELYRRHGSTGIKGRPINKTKVNVKTVDLAKTRRTKPTKIKKAHKSMDMGKKPRVIPANARPDTTLKKGPNQPIY